MARPVGRRAGSGFLLRPTRPITFSSLRANQPPTSALLSVSTLGVTASVTEPATAALVSTSTLGSPVAHVGLGLAASFTVEVGLSYQPSLGAGQLASGPLDVGLGCIININISCVDWEQPLLPDWLPGAFTQGALITPASPGVAAVYADPVYTPPTEPTNTPGVPPAAVPLSKQYTSLKRVSEIYPTPTLDVRGRPVNWQPSNVVISDIGYYQVIIDHRDVSVVGGVPVQINSIVTHEPFGWATADLSWPGVSGYQPIGMGVASTNLLRAFRAGARIDIRLIHPEVSTTAYETLFEGELSTLDDENDNATDPMRWTAIGVMYRADLSLEVPSLLQGVVRDIGVAIPALLVKVVNRTWHSIPEVTTGVNVYRRGTFQPYLTGGAQDMLSLGTTDDGLNQWTLHVYPGRLPRIQLKDMTNVHWTIYYGQRGAKTLLSYDATQWPNSIFGEGTTPEGAIWRNSKYPGINYALVAYPLASSQVFSPGSGTTGFQLMSDLMRRNGYGTMISQDTYLSADVDEIRKAQAIAGVTVDGVVGPQTWVALFGVGTNSGGLVYAHIAPLAVQSYIEPFLYSANGSIIGKNPQLNQTALRVDRMEEFGEGVHKYDAVKSARAELNRDSGIAYSGTINLTVDPNEGSRRLIRAGHNILVRGHRGVDRLLHIAGTALTEGRPASMSLTVSEKPIDLLTLAAITARNKDNTDPARRRLLAQRRSRIFDDQIVAWDSEAGAGTIPAHPVYGGLWTVIRIPSGNYANVVETIIHTSAPTEFAIGIFSQQVTPADLLRLVGNPLRATTTGSPWVTGNTALLAAGWVIAWGDNEQPCGYSPSSKGTDGATLTGDLIDKASWDFQSAQPPWMFIAEYATQSTTISGQLRAAVLQ